MITGEEASDSQRIVAGWISIVLGGPPFSLSQTESRSDGAVQPSVRLFLRLCILRFLKSQ